MPVKLAEAPVTERKRKCITRVLEAFAQLEAASSLLLQLRLGFVRRSLAFYSSQKHEWVQSATLALEIESNELNIPFVFRYHNCFWIIFTRKRLAFSFFFLAFLSVSLRLLRLLLFVDVVGIVSIVADFLAPLLMLMATKASLRRESSQTLFAVVVVHPLHTSIESKQAKQVKRSLCRNVHAVSDGRRWAKR